MTVRQWTARILFVALFVASFFLPTAVALLAGIALAVTLGSPFPVFTKKVSKYLLQASVVGLGFGMNLYSAVESGKDGMLFTIVSVIGVMVIGTLLGRVFRLSRNNSYLISSGTAICGGSAIAAVAPIIDADDNETTLSMVTVFVLNAVALLIFPAIGHLVGLSQEQFGTWAAIAIHDRRGGPESSHDRQADPCPLDYPHGHCHHIYLQEERQEDIRSLVHLPVHSSHAGQYLLRHT